MGVNDTKISLKMKRKSGLSIEKGTMKNLKIKLYVYCIIKKVQKLFLKCLNI